MGLGVLTVCSTVDSWTLRGDDTAQVVSPATSQVELLIQDRPQLRSILQEKNAVRAWLDDAFKNAPEGCTIRWDSRPTPDSNPSSAESSAYPNSEGIAFIRVDGIYKSGVFKGIDRPDEQVLSDVVFELNNVKLFHEKQQLIDHALAGDISRDEYIRGVAKLEYQAELETDQFFRTVWQPFCLSQHRACTPRYWHSPVPPTFEDWLARYPEGSVYPWQYYGKQYDSHIAYRDGISSFRAGDYQQASADFTRALPEGANSYYMRGLTEIIGHNWDLAIEDMRKVDQYDIPHSAIKRYNHLFIWISLSRKGQTLEANRDLAAYWKSLSADAQQDGFGQIAQYLIGQVSDHDLLAENAMETSPNQAMHKAARWYFVGVKRLINGDDASAVEAFQSCLDVPQLSFIEQILATQSLSELKTTPVLPSERNQGVSSK